MGINKNEKIKRAEEIIINVPVGEWTLILSKNVFDSKCYIRNKTGLSLPSLYYWAI
jgi:hypothetical protein